MVKTSGFNFQNLNEDNRKINLDLDMGEPIDMREDRPKKKKQKYNFEYLFPRPKGAEKDMGMGNICDGNAFEGIL
jgi:hypothetical protein